MSVPILDQGFIHGVTVAEQIRTFRGQPFLLNRHYLRWNRGLQLVGIDPPCSLNELQSLISQVMEHNWSLLPERSEQGICIFATPGSSRDPWSEILDREDSNTPKQQPQFSIYTYPIQTAVNQQRYRQGISLVYSTYADVPGECWPKGIKVRSRLHYYLAASQAAHQAQSHDSVFPILLDLQGQVSDSSIGSIAAWSESEGLIVRPANDRYDSISLAYFIGLAKSLGMNVTERYMKAAELTKVDEVFLVSTPWCLYPVKQVDQILLPGQRMGYPIFNRLLQTWESSVGCSILNG